MPLSHFGSAESGGESVRTWAWSDGAQVLERRLGEHERAAGVDLLHQVEALHLELRHRRQVDRRRVVDDDVDPAELLATVCRDRGRDLVRVADVADDRQRGAAHLLDLRRRR